MEQCTSETAETRGKRRNWRRNFNRRKEIVSGKKKKEKKKKMDCCCEVEREKYNCEFNIATVNTVSPRFLPALVLIMMSLHTK